MAKIKSNTEATKKDTQKSNPGIHSTSRTSKLKSSKLYKKLYKGQGK
tara:strand:- start:577 stop:717 length:141 start_codon:yes stop_codon:yes gene_type:complete